MNVVRMDDHRDGTDAVVIRLHPAVLDLEAPHVPAWATGSLPVPELGETFRDYWTRAGVPADTIEACFEGLKLQTACCAHERMAHYVQTVCPQSFEHHLATRLRRPRHDDPNRGRW